LNPDAKNPPKGAIHAANKAITPAWIYAGDINTFVIPIKSNGRS
jgi:hypothetical protein